MSYGEWDILDQKVLGSIQLSLATTVAFNVSRATTQDLMAAPSEMYEKLSASNMIFLDEEVVQPEDRRQRKRR